MSDAPDDLRQCVHGNGADSFRAACEQRLEGVVASGPIRRTAAFAMATIC
ncbi:MAG: hypothetical protein ACLT98_06080 [Eggerthellaceae bacterium]